VSSRNALFFNDVLTVNRPAPDGSIGAAALRLAAPVFGALYTTGGLRRGGHFRLVTRPEPDSFEQPVWQRILFFRVQALPIDRRGMIRDQSVEVSKNGRVPARVRMAEGGAWYSAGTEQRGLLDR
jgi:hypothetical protein